MTHNMIRWFGLQFHHWRDGEQLLRANLQRERGRTSWEFWPVASPPVLWFLPESWLGPQTPPGAFLGSAGLGPRLRTDSALCFAQSEV